MSTGHSRTFRHLVHRLRLALLGPQLLAFIPALSLGAFWFGGEGALLLLALGLPALYAATGILGQQQPYAPRPRDAGTGLPLQEAAERAVTDILAREKATGKTSAILALELDDFGTIRRQYGARASARLLKMAADRLAGSLRESDHVVRLDGARFAVALGPVVRADLEAVITLADRLQKALAEPFSLEATRIFLTASVGFCLPAHAPARTGTAMLEAALSALGTALTAGAGSVRAYAPETARKPAPRTNLGAELGQALETGQIVAWFQPQVATRGRAITGIEALARWQHPQHGLLLPGDFLPALEKEGLQERLCEAMVSQALKALREWDRGGLDVPCVSVNFSSAELSNPKLCDWIGWELDRYELPANRLCAEILESVVATAEDDIIMRNIHALADMGCRIDLDDFGTGHASIANIRRFRVSRIKIDRSFITRLDRDSEQQAMVRAILTLAGQLGIEALAEGVETIGERACLSKLGCAHVQGFSVARPMAPEAVGPWLADYRARLAQMPPEPAKAG